MTNTNNTLNLLLFETGFISPEVVAKHGSFFGIYQQMLTRARLLLPDDSRPAVSLTSVACREDDTEYPPADPAQLGYDGIIITGSPSDAFGDEPWIQRLVDWLREYRANAQAQIAKQSDTSTGIPRIVGICFGHQVMARAFGGKVSRNELGWEVGYSVIDLTPSGVELLVSGGSAMSQSKTSIHINQMHRDIITDIPAGFEVIGSNDNCAAQILVSSDRTIMSMQGHPEYYPAIVRDIVEVRNKSGIFTDEFAQDVYAKLANGHDGDDIGSMILRFFAAGKV